MNKNYYPNKKDIKTIKDLITYKLTYEEIKLIKRLTTNELLLYTIKLD